MSDTYPLARMLYKDSSAKWSVMTPRLYIVFMKSDASRDFLADGRGRSWTAPKSARPGDVALFYCGGASPAIQAIGRAAADAELGEPAYSTSSNRAYFTRYENVTQLLHPLPLDELRSRFPRWGRWRNLRGVKVHIVPDNRQSRFAVLVAQRNAVARSLLAPWLESVAAPVPHNISSSSRELVEVRRRGRSSAFGRRVRSESNGLCAACASPINYEAMGVLEAAHIRPVKCDGPDRISNALALCPSHHAMFDEGLWSVSGTRILFCKDVPIAVREAFRDRIKCKWQLDPDACEWHRSNVFRLK